MYVRESGGEPGLAEVGHGEGRIAFAGQHGGARALALAAGEAHLKQALDVYQRLGMAPDADRVQRRLNLPADG